MGDQHIAPWVIWDGGTTGRGGLVRHKTQETSPVARIGKSRSHTTGQNEAVKGVTGSSKNGEAFQKIEVGKVSSVGPDP